MHLHIVTKIIFVVLFLYILFIHQVWDSMHKVFQLFTTDAVKNPKKECKKYNAHD